MAADPSTLEVQWEELAQGREITATVVMASGFVLPLGSRVRERYRLVGSLGKGGMGQVLSVALVGSPDQQTFALKLVARGAGLRKDGTIDEADRLAAEQQAEMFAELLRQEAAKQDVVQRHGVSVARLFALVQLDDGSIGMRMEMARGRSLEQRIADEVAHRSEAPDTQFSVLIIRKLMTQLRRLHELTAPGSPFGFIHSDIKPGNVFVDDRDRTDPLVTLLDFGVATAGQALAAGLASRGEGRKTLVLDQAGGTIGYAPPHHFTHKPTPLSDVFAAVVMLYELLTGELPWDFAGVPRTVPNLFKVEAIIARPPRPVLAVRPSIAQADADVLDAFFARELAALVALSNEASAALETSDPEPKRAMIERLSALSQSYQARLEQLAQDLGAATTGRAITPSPTSSAADDAPEVSVRDANTMVATPHGIARDVPSTMGARVRTLDGEDDERVSLPVRRSRWRGLLVLVVLVGGAAVAYARFGDEARGVIARLAPQWSGVIPGAGDAATRVEQDAAVARAVAASDAGRGAGVSIADLADAPVVREPSALAAVAGVLDAGTTAAAVAGDAAPADASRPCSCVADAPGTVVIAEGGTLEHEVVLCSTSTAAPDAGEHEFVGTGAIPPEVVGTFPTLRCRNETAVLALTVQRFTLPNGASVPLFRCERSEAPDASVAVPDASLPEKPDASEADVAETDAPEPGDDASAVLAAPTPAVVTNPTAPHPLVAHPVVAPPHAVAHPRAVAPHAASHASHPATHRAPVHRRTSHPAHRTTRTRRH